MRYGQPYVIVDIPPISWKKIQSILDNTQIEESKLFGNWDSNDVRRSQVGWIENREILNLFFDMGEQVNQLCEWNLKIEYLEPLQYTIYPEGGFYDWHVDQHITPVKGEVRKISFTCWVNDSYEGGEFDLEIGNPKEEVRYKTFSPQPGKAIFFMSDWWHRVRPVTSGVRKSLVGWFSGPPYV